MDVVLLVSNCVHPFAVHWKGIDKIADSMVYPTWSIWPDSSDWRDKGASRFFDFFEDNAIIQWRVGVQFVCNYVTDRIFAFSILVVVNVFIGYIYNSADIEQMTYYVLHYRPSAEVMQPSIYYYARLQPKLPLCPIRKISLTEFASKFFVFFFNIEITRHLPFNTFTSTVILPIELSHFSSLSNSRSIYWQNLK